MHACCVVAKSVFILEQVRIPDLFLVLYLVLVFSFRFVFAQVRIQMILATAENN
jgi:hypothetical protein